MLTFWLIRKIYCQLVCITIADKNFYEREMLSILHYQSLYNTKNFNVLDIKIFPFLSFVNITPFLAGIGYAKLMNLN